MNPEENQQSQKDVSDKFLDLIFGNVVSLDIYERRMIEGCEDLIKYMQQFNFLKENINYLREKNMNLMITEFDNCFTNINPIIGEEKTSELIEELEKIKYVVLNGIDFKGKRIYPFDKTYNAQKKKSSLNFTPTFSFVARKLSELKKKTLFSLKHILYAQQGKSSGTMRY